MKFVGVVEPDEALARAAKASAAYKDIPFLTAEQLLNTADLAAVTVETRVPDLLAAGGASGRRRKTYPSRKARRSVARDLPPHSGRGRA